ncbi:hypothetical protein KEM56_001929 [Ascosphaera pollenicola]|nr:hypothetical protein KEM56_001929 [Ascosphaera pollenicola]
MRFHFPADTPDWVKFTIITNSKITPEWGIDKGDTKFLICFSIIIILLSCWWQQVRQDYYDDAPRRSRAIRQREEDIEARKDRRRAEEAWGRGEIVVKKKVDKEPTRQMIVEN